MKLVEYLIVVFELAGGLVPWLRLFDRDVWS